MSAVDPRLTLVRDGLADQRLQGLIPAERFARTRACTIISPSAPLTGASDPAAERASELLFGEGFDVLSEDGEYAFGQTARDGYVGFVQKAALRQGAPSPRWRVSALRTYAFAEPSIKSAAIGPFSRNALIEADRSEGRFVHALGAGWFVREHLAPIGRFDADPARLALDYLGTPYLWGGVSSLGLDCSGLVQQALRACGRACPRDSDQQRSLGRAIEPQDGLARGDLVFWPGHVALLTGPDEIVHANAHHMAVVREPLAEAVARIKQATGSDPMAWRRLSFESP